MSDFGKTSWVVIASALDGYRIHVKDADTGELTRIAVDSVQVAQGEALIHGRDDDGKLHSVIHGAETYVEVL